MKKIVLIPLACMLALSPALGSLTAHSQQQERKLEKPETSRKAPARTKESSKDAAQTFKKGGKYKGKGSEVTNYGSHGLKAPPKGHRWVRDGNRFLLVAIGTGIIASVAGGR